MTENKSPNQGNEVNKGNSDRLKAVIVFRGEFTEYNHVAGGGLCGIIGMTPRLCGNDPNYSFVTHLCAITSDSLECKYMFAEEGNIHVFLEGSHTGLKTLEQLFQSGEMLSARRIAGKKLQFTSRRTATFDFVWDNLEKLEVFWDESAEVEEKYRFIDLIKTQQFEDLDLRGIDLKGANLMKIDLRGVDFRGTDLSSANFKQANLSGANLSGANLSGTYFQYANLQDANLSGANLQDNNFDRASLSGANLSGVNLSKVYLYGANLSGVNLSGANLSGANLCHGNLSKADLSSTNLKGADLSFANFRGAKINEKTQLDDKSYLVWKILNQAAKNIRGANLSSTNLKDADLSEADLSETDLSHAHLNGANLRGANLRGANLSSANISGADLKGVKLRKSSFGHGKISESMMGDLISQGVIFKDYK